MSGAGEHRAARIAILAAGAIGGLVAARTAAFYLGVDRIALGLSTLIGVGLAFGIAELLSRVSRAECIVGELAKLPRPATLEAINTTSPELRSVLRARLHGVRAAVPSAGFAPYLVGLLVMVGLLGTFLGLVDALRSTRDVLGTSGNIDALRGALATPMLGLSRAFGTSAAGLCASAMLGLATVFARRVEASLARAVHAYGDDALGPLTIAERQIALLETLVREQVEATAAAARATAAVEVTAASLRADLAAGISDVGRTVEGALTPALERAVARASDVTRERLEDWTRLVEREAEVRRAHDEALASAWTEVTGASAERVACEGARALGELRGALGESLSALDTRLGAAVDALAGRLGDRTEEVSANLDARLAALTSRVDAMVRGLSGELEGTRERLDRALEATSRTLEEHAERSIARERAREQAGSARIAELAQAEARALSHLERHVEAVDAALAMHLERMTAMQAEASREATERAAALEAVLRDRASGLTAEAAEVLAGAARRADAATVAAEQAARAARDEIAARAAMECAQAERAQAVLAGLAAAAEQVSARTSEVLTQQAVHRAELEAKWLEARDATERAQAERAEAVISGLAAAAEQVSSRAGEMLTEQAARQAAIEAKWQQERDGSAARLLVLLEEHAAGLAEGLGATRTLVDEAAGLLRASGAEMGAVAEVFTGAVDRYRDASAATLTALASVDEAVDRAGKKAAIELLTDYLDQTREVFEHSLEVQRELFAELRALRSRGQASAASEKASVRA